MECNEASGKGKFCISIGIFLLLLTGTPALAQIGEEAYSHRQELRYSLQEAREIETIYDNTHLNLDKRNFKKGQASQKQTSVITARDYNKKTKRPSIFSRKTRTLFGKKKN